MAHNIGAGSLDPASAIPATTHSHPGTGAGGHTHDPRIRCSNCLELRYPSDLAPVRDIHGTWQVCKTRIGRPGVLCRDPEPEFDPTCSLAKNPATTTKRRK